MDTSLRSTEYNAATSEKCTCVSISPGVTVRPPSSITCVAAPIRARMSSFDPTATILPPAIATAWATESRASTVRICPFCSTRSAGVVCADGCPIASTSARPATTRSREDKDSAIRESINPTINLKSEISPRRPRHDVELRRHVAVERDRAQIAIRRRVVHVDRIPGVVDVEQPAVRAGLERHARPARELGAGRDAFLVEIERPELVAIDARLEPVAVFPVGCEHKAQGHRGADRVELEILLGQVDPRHAHHAAVLHRIFDR